MLKRVNLELATAIKNGGYPYTDWFNYVDGQLMERGTFEYETYEGIENIAIPAPTVGQVWDWILSDDSFPKLYPAYDFGLKGWYLVMDDKIYLNNEEVFDSKDEALEYGLKLLFKIENNGK